MSSNDLHNRKSRLSDEKFENSSIRSIRSLKSELNNLSVELPKAHKKYTQIQKQIINKRKENSSVVINLTSTKYPIIQRICLSEDMGWKVENYNDSKYWAIKWCDSGVTSETLNKMNHLQRVNHFPGMSAISRKNTLAANLGRMKLEFPHDFSFYPRTFLFPSEAFKLKQYFMEARKRNLLKTFIVKPEASCQGRGIYITQNLLEIQKQQKCVIQKYISNPLLVDGLKFDLRIYVLVASCNPLRIYLYNEGLVRFATERYEFPDSQNLSNLFMHLTNYAINKDHPSYEFNNSIYSMTKGHKQSLAQFFKKLKELGYKANNYWSQIKDIIIKTLIAGQPQLYHQYKLGRPFDVGNDMCFEVLGFDFMMDNKDQCYLLEVNHTPSFSADTPLDELIKFNLLKDTLLMMNFSSKEIQIKEEIERINQREKILKIKHPNSLNEKASLVQRLLELRIQNQKQYLGTFQNIYPSKNIQKQEKYQQMLSFSAKSYQNLSLNLSNPISQVFALKKIQKPSFEIPIIKEVSKNALRKMVTEISQPRKKIYNYNVKNSNGSSNSNSNKKIVHSLPSKDQNNFNKNIKVSLDIKSRVKTQQVLQKEGLKGSLGTNNNSTSMNSSIHRPVIRSMRDDYMDKISTLEPQDLSTFRKRIRAYRTPLMQ